MSALESLLLMEIPKQPDAGPAQPVLVRDPRLLRALGRLVRGLSCLFWGLPVVLLAAVQTAKADPARPVHLWSTLVAFGLLLYGIHQLAAFQPQERVWQLAVDRVRMAALVNLGLCPFVYWWSRFPNEQVFQWVVDLLVLAVLVFLIELNPLLDRLVAMLPDEGLRQETRVFTRVGRFVLVPVLAVVAFYLILLRVEPSFPALTPWFAFLTEGGLWVVLFVALLPVALTMALVWKIKELIFHSVFGA